MSKDFQYILDALPYKRPFHFVDKIIDVNENGAIGEYTFREDEFFYPGHFKGNPITPGVILVECMAQIGLVALAIFLIRDQQEDFSNVAFSSSKTDFLKMVLPGDKVRVESIKKYMRFGKLNCDVNMYNAQNELVCKGNLSGFLVKQKES